MMGQVADSQLQHHAGRVGELAVGEGLRGRGVM